MCKDRGCGALTRIPQSISHLISHQRSICESFSEKLITFKSVDSVPNGLGRVDVFRRPFGFERNKAGMMKSAETADKKIKGSDGLRGKERRRRTGNGGERETRLSVLQGASETCSPKIEATRRGQ